MPAPGFLPALAEWCRDNGVVFVADEVQTGFARTGAMFASEHEGVVPDLIVTAKGIAGGLPLSAVTGRTEMMDSVHVGGLGGTYGGNPLACAAALAVMDTIVEEGLVERAGQVERILTERLERIRAADPRVGDVRGRGAMMAVELVEAGTTHPGPGHGEGRRRRGAPQRRRGAHLRHLRQRAALPAAAGHLRRPAARGLRRARRCLRRDGLSVVRRLRAGPGVRHGDGCRRPFP